jgi:hypothetical protein
MALPPIAVQPESSVEDDASQRSIDRSKGDAAVMTRELPPPVPDTRRRTIFSFDRAELMEENKALTAEIRELTALVERLREVIQMNEGRKKGGGGRKVIENRTHRSDSIYHPPGLAVRKRGARTGPR